MEIILVGGRLFHVEKETDGQPDDITKLIAYFCNFAKAFKIIKSFVKYKQLRASATNFNDHHTEENEDTQNLLSQNMMRNLIMGLE